MRLVFLFSIVILLVLSAMATSRTTAAEPCPTPPLVGPSQAIFIGGDPRTSPNPEVCSVVILVPNTAMPPPKGP